MLIPFYSMPDGEQLFVREYGQGQPVLVLSGLGMLSWQWTVFLYPYKHQFRFIIPEWRGFGASKSCKIPPAMDAISCHWQDVRSVVDQLNIQEMIVIAYSMGASTFMHGLKYDDFAKRITAYLHIDQTPKIPVDETWPFGLFGQKHDEFNAILQQTSLLLAKHQQVQQLAKLDKAVRQQIATLWLRFIRLQNHHPYSLKAFEFFLNQPRLQTILLPSSRLDYLAWYINNYLHHREDYREALTKLECPVTFFSGAQSRLYPLEGQRLIAQSLPQAKQIIFKKSGHSPLMTEPLKFAKELGKFLTQNLAAKHEVY